MKRIWIAVALILVIVAGLWALPSTPCNGLLWNPIEGAMKYTVYWRTDPVVAYVQANSKDVGILSNIKFAVTIPTVETATKTTKHWFVVTASDAGGESQFSNEVSCKKPIGSPTITAQ